MNPLPEICPAPTGELPRSENAGPAPRAVPQNETAVLSRVPTSGLRRVNPLQQAGWDELIKAHSDFCFFHSSAWAKVLHDTYGFTPVYFACSDERGLLASLPVIEADSWLVGRRGVSLPFTDECCPLTTDPIKYRGILREVIEYGKLRKWKYLECKGGKSLVPEIPASLCFYGHTLELAGGEKELFDRCDSGVRRAIRKAGNAGVQVEICQTLEAMRVFYSLHCKTRDKHGLPPQPFSFFLNIFQHIVSKDLGFVALAKYGQTPIAAAIFFHMGKHAIYKFGASDQAFQHVRGNNLVMWEAVKWYAHHGFESIHFGKTSITNEGLRRFKRGWGTAEHKIEYLKYDLRKDNFVMDKDQAVGWYNKVFNKMPPFASRLAGALLYKHVA